MSTTRNEIFPFEMTVGSTGTITSPEDYRGKKIRRVALDRWEEVDGDAYWTQPGSALLIEPEPDNEQQ